MIEAEAAHLLGQPGALGSPGRRIQAIGVDRRRQHGQRRGWAALGRARRLEDRAQPIGCFPRQPGGKIGMSVV